jgi:PAS domain S-box-containing protein
VLVFAFEVTEQVQSRQRADRLQAEALEVAQEVVRQRETLYQLFEKTPAAIAILHGPEHRFQFLNAAYQDLFQGRQLQGRALSEALPEAVDDGFVNLLDEVYRTGQTYFGQEQPLTERQPDGSVLTRYFTFTYQAYYENEQVIGVSIFAYEVTGQVLARQQAAALQEEMRHHDEQLQALFEQAPVAIGVMREPALIVELANPGMCELWGRSRTEVLGKPLLDALPELQGQGFDQLVAEVMNTGVAYTASEQQVYLRRPGRSEPEAMYINFVYHPLRDARGVVTGVAAIATEVTEQVRARQELARANAELTAANKEAARRNEDLAATNRQLTRTNQDLDNFVYAASHDLKQPINNLAGLFHELSRTVTFSDPDDAPLLPMIGDALVQLSTTVNDLAAVGQVQQQSTLPPERVDLEDLTQEVLQTLQPQMLTARARVTTDFGAQPVVTYSRANLRTILLNLVSNSLKYADPARPARVHLSVWVHEGRPVLLVEDNGLGFDLARHEQELFHLFRRFHDHTEGTGVGLYLVNRIVQGNGGRIEVESEVGQGATFRLFL